jgi:hypothetical protein
MPDEETVRADHPPLCPRCKEAHLVETVSIAPLIDEPGLIAYECQRCGYVTSVLVPAEDVHPGGSR